jgi:hypothetical protein
MSRAIESWPIQIGQCTIVLVEELSKALELLRKRVSPKKRCPPPDGFGEVAAIEASLTQ